jgi:isopentenyl-diphosphate delta-isomerase
VENVSKGRFSVLSLLEPNQDYHSWYNPMADEVILVNQGNEPIGVGEKIQTHLKGELHRAFSIFVFNSSGELLLQMRAKTKYHSRSLWSNTCCGHPKPGETTLEAAHRRLLEEMGFDCELREIFCFLYKARIDEQFFEHEYDHVLCGVFDEEPILNLSEAENWMFVDLSTLRRNVQNHPRDYTYWLRFLLAEPAFFRQLNQVRDQLNNNRQNY